MSARPEPVLFEAVCTSHQSLGDRGMRAVAFAVVGASSGIAALFLALGAWPIVGFAGLEALLVLGLLARHRRGGRRAMEVLALAGDHLVVRRTDTRGRREEQGGDAARGAHHGEGHRPHASVPETLVGGAHGFEQDRFGAG